jgi:colicin import membrane protein
MKKFILVSLFIHIFLGSTFFYLNKNLDKKGQEQVTGSPKKESVFESEKNKDIKKNIKREDIMNAIAISEEELSEEISRIKNIEKQKNIQKEQEQLILEESVKMEKKKIDREKQNNLELLKRKEDLIKAESDKLKKLQTVIKEDKRTLSQKQNKLLQEKNNVDIKKEENLKLLDYMNNRKTKEANKLKEKQQHIQEQSEYIKRQEDEIENLKDKLKNEYRNKIKSNQTVLTDKKEKKNSFLEKLSIEEQEIIKSEMEAYNLIIKEKIVENWKLPKNTKTKTECVINLTQSNTGVVLAVGSAKCSQNENVQESIKKAVWDASPLPLPKRKMLFDKHIQLYFTVK